MSISLKNTSDRVDVLWNMLSDNTGVALLPAVHKIETTWTKLNVSNITQYHFLEVTIDQAYNSSNAEEKDMLYNSVIISGLKYNKKVALSYYLNPNLNNREYIDLKIENGELYVKGVLNIASALHDDYVVSVVGYFHVPNNTNVILYYVSNIIYKAYKTVVRNLISNLLRKEVSACL